VIVPMSQDYKLSSGALNTNSDLIKTIDCVKGAGNTAYANSIEAAQAELDRNGRADVADVIVFLSDGAANIGPTYYPTTSPYRTKPCHQGVTRRGTRRYEARSSTRSAMRSRTTRAAASPIRGLPESPLITVTDALTSIATNPGNFYNQPTPGQLNTIYTQIAADIGTGTSALTSDTTP